MVRQPSHPPGPPRQREAYARGCLKRKMKAGVSCSCQSAGELGHGNVSHGQRSTLAHLPFCELGAQQNPSLGGQWLAQAGRRDSTRGPVSDGSQTRASYWKAGSRVQGNWWHAAPTAALPQPTLGQAWDHYLSTSASHHGQPCQ